MTDAQFQKANALIAEFMGFEKAEYKLPRYTFKRPLHYPILWGEDSSTMDMDALQMPFHLEWHWIMPVLSEIEKLGYEWSLASSNQFCIADHGDSSFQTINEHTHGVAGLYSDLLGLVYLSVLKFIEVMRQPA